ncbi:MAG: sigma-70 family RNA polymerase sigma factor [Actinomycetota bacterium]
MSQPPLTTLQERRLNGDGERPDSQRIECLYQKHRLPGVRFAGRRGAEDPESLFDQVFVDVVNRPGLIASADDDTFAAYLTRAIKNGVISEHRKRAATPIAYDEEKHGRSCSADRPDGLFEDDVVQSAWVLELLDHLTDSERRVVVSRYFEDKDSIEIARSLDKTPEAVRQLHRSAMLRLRFVLTVTAVVVVALAAVTTVLATRTSGVPTAPADGDRSGPEGVIQPDGPTTPSTVTPAPGVQGDRTFEDTAVPPDGTPEPTDDRAVDGDAPSAADAEANVPTEAIARPATGKTSAATRNRQRPAAAAEWTWPTDPIPVDGSVTPDGPADRSDGSQSADPGGEDPEPINSGPGYPAYPETAFEDPDAEDSTDENAEEADTDDASSEDDSDDDDTEDGDSNGDDGDQENSDDDDSEFWDLDL